MKQIGENIAVLRKNKGMTQEALASDIGVSPQAVSKWENGTNLPDIALAEILRSRKTMFTLGVICQKCDIENETDFYNYNGCHIQDLMV